MPKDCNGKNGRHGKFLLLWQIKDMFVTVTGSGLPGAAMMHLGGHVTPALPWFLKYPLFLSPAIPLLE